MNNERGFTTADIIVSLMVIVIFISIITSGFYNYYIASTGVSRNSAALAYTIDIIETVEEMHYSDVTQENVNNKIQQLYENKTIPESYKVSATIQKYNETAGNASKKDLIKTLTVTVSYEVGKKIEQIQISRLITM